MAETKSGKLKVLIVDGQGGGLGRQLVSALKDEEGILITAVGTNSTATAAMHRAGAHQSATGENAVIVACRTADVILGAVGILMGDAFLGEITPAMALAIGQSGAQKVLIPMNRCGVLIAGAGARTTGQYVEDAAALVRQLLHSEAV